MLLKCRLHVFFIFIFFDSWKRQKKYSIEVFSTFMSSKKFLKLLEKYNFITLIIYYIIHTHTLTHVPIHITNMKSVKTFSRPEK